MQYIFILILMFIFQFAYAEAPPLNILKLPPGFSIELYAYPVPGARSLALGTKNKVFVGSKEEGKVYVIVPDLFKHKTKTFIIASGLFMPNGITFYKNSLYVAEVNRIIRYDDIDNHLKGPPQPVVITNNLPNKTDHGWRYLHIGPDKKIYLSVGAPCNSCLEKDPRFGTILRMDLNGNNQEIYAKGVRNSLGFDWDENDHLWFTDNGRDWLGDDVPPDELNCAPRSRLNFGFPYCHGKNILDPEFGKGRSCASFTPPILELPAHAATLGMRFYKGKMFPDSYKGQIFIAEHGSWNRSTKIGYEVISVKLSKNKKMAYALPFITGWLNHMLAWGRPVDVLEMPDGSLLISDDKAGAVYRVSYKK